VKDYNVKVTSFPGNIMAGMFGFKKKDMFIAEAGANKAPDVNDEFNKQ
jgi:LemA protein